MDTHKERRYREMDLMELMKERYSLRKFSDRKVEQEKIDLMLEAARLAPTGVNYQPQRISVIESEENLAKIKECTKYHFNAPLTFIICSDTTSSWHNMYDEDYAMGDLSIAAAQMMLEAVVLGLGTTYVGAFDRKLLAKTFQLPNFLLPMILLPTGYPAEGARPSRLHSDRLPNEKMFFKEGFAGIEPLNSRSGDH